MKNKTMKKIGIILAVLILGTFVVGAFGTDIIQDPVAVHDLAVTDVYTLPESPTVGELTTINVTVKNKRPYPEDATVSAYVDGCEVGSTQIVLSGDQTMTLSFTWTPSAGKAYYVMGEVLRMGSEFNMDDNSMADNRKGICVIVEEGLPSAECYEVECTKVIECEYEIISKEGTECPSDDMVRHPCRNLAKPGAWVFYRGCQEGCECVNKEDISGEFDYTFLLTSVSTNCTIVFNVTGLFEYGGWEGECRPVSPPNRPLDRPEVNPGPHPRPR